MDEGASLMISGAIIPAVLLLYRDVLLTPTFFPFVASLVVVYKDHIVGKILLKPRIR